MWHAFSPPCCIAGDHVKWQWQPPPPGLVKGCPCSMDRNQSWPANPYTQAYNRTGLHWRKRLYILCGRSESAPPVCEVSQVSTDKAAKGRPWELLVWSAYLGWSKAAPCVPPWSISSPAASQGLTAVSRTEKNKCAHTLMIINSPNMLPSIRGSYLVLQIHSVFEHE